MTPRNDLPLDQPSLSAADSFMLFSASKWMTMWLYNRGHLSFEGCQAAFKAHPEWKHA